MSNPTLKIKVLPRFPSSVAATSPVTLDTTGGNYTIGLDVTALEQTLDGRYAQTSGAREVLTASRTYYVRADGSDSNTGLADSAGGAFLTIQKAINTVAGLDINTRNVTIQVRAGTFTGGVSVTGPWLGSGTVTLTGDTTTPSNVVISTTSANCVSVSNGGYLVVQGFKLTAATSGFLLVTSNFGRIDIGNKMEFGAYASGGIANTSGGIINNFATAVTISGGGSGVFLANDTNAIFSNQVVTTWTVSGNITVTTFATASNAGYLNANSVTFSIGAFTVTGTRFTASNGGRINTSGGGANFFPGTVAGSGTNFGASPWGLYL